MNLEAWNSIIGSIAALKRECAQLEVAGTVAAPRTLARAVNEAAIVRADGQARALAREPIAASPTLRLRDGALARLEQLRTSLALSDAEAKQFLFPLTIYFDQLISEAAPGAFEERGSLQRVLFDIDDGGEQFYVALERVLRERTVPLLYELYYFLLKDGFLGRYEAHDPERAAYLRALGERIEDRAPRVLRERAPAVERVVPPARYYGLAGAVVAATLAVLWCASELEVMAWSPEPLALDRRTSGTPCPVRPSRR